MSTLRRDDAAEPDDETMERLRTMVYDRIAADRQSRPSERRGVSTFWRLYAVAATLLLPLLLAGAYLMWHGEDVAPATEYTTVTTVGNNRSQIVLPDGSMAVVMGESTLEFPTSFADGERVVKLNGYAGFDVVSDSVHPFRVETPNIDVTVLGTRFSVVSRRNVEYSEVFLDRGKVEVTASASRQMATLAPGEIATINNGSGQIEVKSSSPTVDFDWFTDELIFRRATPDSLIGSIEHTYGIRLSKRVTDRISSRFSGTLPANDLATTMEVLCSVYGFDMPYSYQDNTITERFSPRAE